MYSLRSTNVRSKMIFHHTSTTQLDFHHTTCAVKLLGQITQATLNMVSIVQFMFDPLFKFKLMFPLNYLDFLSIPLYAHKGNRLLVLVQTINAIETRKNPLLRLE